jgi:hypothetical protein
MVWWMLFFLCLLLLAWSGCNPNMHPRRKALHNLQLSQLFGLCGVAGRDPLDNAYWGTCSRRRRGVRPCFSLGRSMGLDTQVDALISLMKLVFSNLWSSATIALHFGSSNHRRGCLTGRAFGSTFTACSTSSLGTLGIFEGHQAKISQRSWRNTMSALSYAGLGRPRWTLSFLGPCGEPKISWSLE